MNEQHAVARYVRRGSAWAAAFCLAAATVASAQQTAPAAPQSNPAPVTENAKAGTRITPEQARQLFSLVDQLLKFSSQETSLPIKRAVKRQIISPPAVESY